LIIQIIHAGVAAQTGMKQRQQKASEETEELVSAYGFLDQLQAVG